MRRLKNNEKLISRLIAGISIIGLTINPLAVRADANHDPGRSSGYAKATILSLAERSPINNMDTKAAIEVTLNGDNINIDNPIWENNELLVPMDFFKYFPAEYSYSEKTGLIWIEAATSDTVKRYAVGCAKINSDVAYISTSITFNEIPYDNENAYAQNKVIYKTSAKIINSKVYIPARFAAEVLGSEFNFDGGKNTLTWTDDKVSKYPTLQEALRKKLYLKTDEFEYSMKANFIENRYDHWMRYDNKAKGQFVFPGSATTPHDFHIKTENNSSSDIKLNGYNKVEKKELIKVGSKLYTKDQKGEKYKLTDTYAQDKYPKEYSSVSESNSTLLLYFTRYNTFDVYRNVHINGQKTTKYVLKLTDAAEINHFFGFTRNKTVSGKVIDFNNIKPAPFPQYTGFFFGDHAVNRIGPTNDDLPKFKGYSAKVAIYVNNQNEIVKEVFYNKGKRIDFATRLSVNEYRKEFRDIDYSFTYEIKYKPFSGRISPPDTK